MDLLCKVYGGTSDEEDDNGGIHLQRPILPQPKRAKFENFYQVNNHLPLYKSNPSTNLPAQASLPGRYISKRERAAMASVEKAPDVNTTFSSNSSPGFATAPSSLFSFLLKKLGTCYELCVWLVLKFCKFYCTLLLKRRWICAEGDGFRSWDMVLGCVNVAKGTLKP